jgi:formate-dependent nitrite reductase membrane component NrfD
MSNLSSSGSRQRNASTNLFIFNKKRRRRRRVVIVVACCMIQAHFRGTLLIRIEIYSKGQYEFA